jgi:hypothetical protein
LELVSTAHAQVVTAQAAQVAQDEFCIKVKF